MPKTTVSARTQASNGKGSPVSRQARRRLEDRLTARRRWENSAELVERISRIEGSLLGLVTENATLRAHLEALGDELVTRRLRVVDVEGATQIALQVHGEDGPEVKIGNGPEAVLLSSTSSEQGGAEIQISAAGNVGWVLSRDGLAWRG